MMNSNEKSQKQELPHLPDCNPDQDTFSLTNKKGFKIKPAFKKEQRIFDAVHKTIYMGDY